MLCYLTDSFQKNPSKLKINIVQIGFTQTPIPIVDLPATHTHCAIATSERVFLSPDTGVPSLEFTRIKTKSRGDMKLFRSGTYYLQEFNHQWKNDTHITTLTKEKYSNKIGKKGNITLSDLQYHMRCKARAYPKYTNTQREWTYTYNNIQHL